MAHEFMGIDKACAALTDNRESESFGNFTGTNANKIRTIINRIYLDKPGRLIYIAVIKP